MEQEQLVMLNKISKSPLPPFTKGGLGGITGLTLIEVLIALVVFLLISIALMQTALVVIDSNMINVLRDEAVNIAEMRMNDARNLGFTDTVDNLVSDAGGLAGACPAGFSPTGLGLLVERDFRNISDFDFCTNREVNDLDIDNKEVIITVGWIWKGQDYTHSITTIVRRQ